MVNNDYQKALCANFESNSAIPSKMVQQCFDLINGRADMVKFEVQGRKRSLEAQLVCDQYYLLYRFKNIIFLEIDFYMGLHTQKSMKNRCC